MRECSSCSAPLDEFATVCEQCGQQAFLDPVAADPFKPAVGPVEQKSSAPLPKTGLHQRELAAGVGAALVVALLTLGMLMARGSSSTEVAAANRAANVAAAATPTAAASSAVTVKWSTANQKHWTGNLRHSAAFELDAENTVAVWMRQVRPLLVVRCLAKTTEAFVITDSALKIEPQTDDHTVTVKFDDETELQERWQDADDHNALFAPDATAFTRRLTTARTLRFGYHPHNAEPVVAEFHVGGLAPLIEPAAKNCGWTK